MSSSDAESEGRRPPAKKQRVPKEGVSCDRCRKRKIQCNGRLGGEKCRYCSQNGWECEYVLAKRKYQVGYVKALEDKIDRLYRALKRLHPNEDFTNEVGQPFNEDTWPQDGYLKCSNLTSHSTLDEPSAFVSAVPQLTLTITLDELHTQVEQDSDSEHEHMSKLRNLTDGLSRMSIANAYVGRHSEADLVRSALTLAHKFTGARLSLNDLASFGRPEFWQHRPWDLATPKMLILQFPPHDLLRALVGLYFEHQNLYMPVLHRPTFMRLLSMGLHNDDLSFGFLVLSVCANGARYSDDPRTFLHADSRLSAGWHWFNQVWDNFAISNGSSRLHDLQCICLSTIYLMGCAATQASWVWCGHGIRLAQDVGAHRKSVYDESPTAVDEQYKRVFWILTLLDKQLGMCMARPNAAREQEFDLNLPTTCDDEYWDHPDPSMAYKQPDGIPSRLDLLVCYMKLYHAIAPTMCLIFSGARSRAMVGISKGWERPTIANLDSRLTVWAESVPTHLRWNPDSEDDVYLLQSAHLWTRYHELQINLHRPFIPSHSDTPKEAVAEIGFPSLSICLSASRAIVRIIECVHRRFPDRLFPLFSDSAFLAGMTLFTGIWGSSKFGVASRTEEDLRSIHTCEEFLETHEIRLHTAGRQRDVIVALLSLVDEPPSKSARGQKRAFDATQVPEAPLAVCGTESATAFTALDDWFAGTQFDPLLPSLHPDLGPAIIPATAPENASSWPREFDTAALGYNGGPLGGYSLLGEDHWGLEPYEGQSEFERLFQDARTSRP